jgi:hypothetical protein
LLLALLVGLAGAAVLTTVAGARRSSTAYDRFRQETLASDLDVSFDGPPSDDMDATARAVQTIPEVVALGRLDFPFVVPADSGFYPYLDFLAAVSADDDGNSDIGLPRFASGRLPERADEVAIVDSYADEAGIEVDDRVEFESYAPDQMDALFTTGDAGPPAGPRFTFLVTAILEAPDFLSSSTGDFTPRMFLPPAFREEHGGEVATYPGGFSLRLRRGDADTEAVTSALREMFADEATNLEITPATEVTRQIDSSIDVIVTALLLSALVAAVAGCAAVAQALARHFGSRETSEQTLVALGMTRMERVASQAVTAAPIALGGAAVAVLLSVLASPLMPVGVARRAEPDPGVSIDGNVLLAGAVAIAIVVVVLAALAATGVARRARRRADEVSRGPSRWLQGLRRTSLPPAAATGVGMALEPRGGSAWAVRSAHLGVALGITGLVAVLVVVASVDRLVDSPGRYGAPFDALLAGFTGDVIGDGGDAAVQDPRTERVGLGFAGLARVGGQQVHTHALESLKGDMSLTLLDGHEPTGGGEVVLGTSTLEAAGGHVGDQVDIDGAAGTLHATVVGTGVFPVIDERSAPGRGVLLGLDDFERISAEEEINADLLVTWAAGVDPVRANEELAEETGAEVFAPRLPSDVNNLRQVQGIPQVLAAFLATLAALAVVHALVATVRLRRRDLAVLRALGFQRSQLRSTVMWQATAIGLIGLITGIPLGLIAGRAVWGALADAIGVVGDPVTPIAVVALIAVGAFVVLDVAALLPSRTAGQVAAATVLRTDA